MKHKNISVQYPSGGILFILIALLMGTSLVSYSQSNSPIIHTFAGNGISGTSGNGGPATSAEFVYAYGVLEDASGNVYISDWSGQNVRIVNTSGIINTFAGTGTAGYSGDGGPATAADIDGPQGLAIDAAGNIYIADANNDCVRKINTSGIISTVAGGGSSLGDGGPATAGQLSYDRGVALDASGNLYIADDYDNRVRIVNTSGIINTFAGTGAAGYPGDGGQATATGITDPVDVAVDPSGNVYIADQGDLRYLKVNTSGIITTIAGNGTSGNTGDGGPASAAEIQYPISVKVDGHDNVYIVSNTSSNVRIINSSGIINAYAGTGTSGFSGDGGPATAAELYYPYIVSVTPSGNKLYIADAINYRIRLVTAPFFNVTAIATAGVICDGGSNGSAIINTYNGTSPYTYSWSPIGGSNATATGLSAGTYSVTVTDGGDSTATATVIITQPVSLSIRASVISSNACTGGGEGNATVSASGGTSPYTYSWSTGSTTSSTGSVLSAGTYMVSVLDNCGTSASATVIMPSSGLRDSIVTSSVVNISCSGTATGQATVGVMGGASPYNYSWSNGVTSGATSTLNAGSYSVTVTDANGCTVTASGTITQPYALRDSTLTSSIVNVSCSGESTGSASVGAKYGVLPYTYSWSGGGGNNSSASNLSAGNYTVTIQDACDASVTTSVTITQPGFFTTPTITSTNVTCIGGNNGAATASEESAGTQTFSYTGVIQHFAIPEGISQVTVSVTGAAGGANDYEGNLAGGPGASFTGVCSVTAGHILSVVVGGAGGNANASEGVGGGGGASWVYDSTAQPGHSGTPSLSTLLAVAGGGGGTGWDINDAGAAGGTNLSTNLTTTGTGDDSQPGSSVGGTGGNGGEGGQASPGTSNTDGGGTGGAGWLSNGENSTVTTPTYYGGNDWANSFASIPSNYSYEGGTGGFGGGGASGIDGGGGGGGYNGGGGGYEGLGGAGGGGGGSFFNTAYGSLPATVTATNTGNGSVTIYYNAIAAGAYTYSWSGGQTTSSISSLSAGTYTVTLESSCGATASASVTITQPNTLSTTATAASNACNGTSNGNASATPSGGTSPYTYSWSTGATSNPTGAILGGGTYTVTVEDNCGNLTTASVTIQESPVMTASTNITSTIACNGASTGGANVGTTGGVSPYTYSWSNGVTSSATSALSAGNYSVTVTDMNGCTTTSSVTITQPNPLRDSIITSSIVNISCSGLSTGSATVGVKYGVSPYTYSWSGGAGNNSSASNLSAETYTVTVQDACGNSVAASVTITQPGIFTTPVIASTNVTCIGGSNGSASAGEPSSSGGTSNYSYNGTVTNGTGTVQTFTVPSGVTQLSITLAGGQGGYAGNTAYPGGDGAGFTGAVSVTPGHVLGIVVGGQGESGVTAADGGGGGGGSYVWDENTTTLLAVAAGGGGTGWSLTTGFAAGGIDLTGNSTTNSSGGNAAGGTGGNGGAGGTVASSNGNAGGGAGWISNGGNATDLSPYYSYGGSDMANGFTGGEGYNNDAYGGYGGGGGGGYYGGGGGGGYNGGGGGNYSPTTPGGGGGSYLIEGTTNLIGSATATNTGNGSVVISYPTIATGAYTYSWSNGQTTSSVTGLSAGTYTVTIVSSCGASASSSVTITQPNTLSVTATGSSNACNGTNNGNAVAFPSGGTSPYTYSWSNGITSNPTGATLSGGTYTITVEDNCENSASTSVIIQSSSLLTATTSVTSGIACNGASAGAANVGVTGGVSPYTYSWSNGNTSTAISALNAGTYSVTVTDNNGCTTTASATITQPVALSATTSAIANVICYGQSTGSASVTASNGSSPYTYSWAGGLGNNTTISNLSAGIYTVTVQDNCSASVTATVTITQPAAITTPVIASTNVTCIGGNNGSASASELASSGGNQTFSYTGVIQNFTVPGGVTQVTVTLAGAAGGVNDDGGVLGGPGASFTGVCSVTSGHVLSIVVGGAGNIATVSDDAGGGGGASWIYDSTVTGAHTGTPSLSGLIAVAAGGGGAGWSDDDAGAAGGTDLVGNSTTTGAASNGTVPGSGPGGTGGNGGVGGQCSPYPSCGAQSGGGGGGAGWISNGGTDAPPADGGNDWVNIFASVLPSDSGSGAGGFGGGGGGGGNSSTTGSGGGGGGYNGGGGGLEGLSGAGGGGGGSFFNTAYGSLPTNATATNTGNGLVTISYPAAAQGAYTYSWSNGATTTSIAGLSAGTYTLTLENSCGASASASVTITQPNALSVTASVITGACNGTNNGSASASLSGGTSPYTYSWSNGTTTAATGDILSEGTYTVTVHDNCGNSATASVNIIQSPVMTATTSVTAPILCNGGATGAADVGVSGGISPYTYSWSEGGGTNATINTYSVAGTDNFSFNGNLAAGTGTIQTFTVPAGVTQVSITVTGAQGGDGNNTTTNVGADGAGFTGIATVTPGHVLGIVVGGMGDDLTTTDAGGGGGGGTYVWDENTTTLIAVAGGGGGAGYSVASLGIGGTNLTTNATTTSGADSPGGTGGNGGTGGAATYGAGGAGWLSNGGAASPAAGGSDMANGFTGGSNSSYPAQNGGYGGGGGGGYNGGAGGGGYNGGGGSNGDYGGGGGGSYFNTAYGSLPTTVTATNTGNGSVAISYSTLSGTGIIAGTYSVTITDNNGCTTTASVSITQPAVLSASASITANISCYGQNNGSLSVTASNGTSPYTYSWSGGLGANTSISGLSAGTYTVTVQDNCGASITASVNLTQPAAVTAPIVTYTNVTCNSGSNGSAIAQELGGSGGNKTFSYTGNIQNFTVPAGVTQITVSVTGGGGGYGENSAYLGGPGASFTGVASVTSGHVLSVVVGQLGTGYGGGSGGGGGGGASWVYDSTETGAHTGTPALSALIAVAGGGGAASYYNSGVTGGAGGTNLTTNASTSGTVGSTAGGTGGNGGAAPTLSGSGGAGGGWISNGGFYTAGTGGNDWANSFAIVTPVTYGAGGFGGGGAGEGNGGGGGGGYNGGGGGLEGVGGGCGGGGGSYFNTAYGSLPTNATATNTGNGSVTIMYPATAGGAYTYTWSPGGQTGSNATGLSAGTYTVTAENSCGASATASVIITQPNVLTASAAPINGACNGSSNGNALASPSGGASPYTYSWSYGGTANPTGAVLSAGTYSVTIHDNCGNSATASVNIIQSPVMTATTTVTTALVCNGANTGVANVGVTGGISPYTYSWSSGGGTNSTINSYSLAATQTFSYTGAIQTFTVPVGVSQVSITLAGAQGGEGDASATYLGGDGAGFIGVVTVTPNHVLGIVTGGQGLTTTTGAPGGGGGGGSYVWDENTTTLLAVAGGGGGAGYSSTGTAETGGTNLSTNATTSISSDGAGGTGGNGGAGGSATAPGGGGAGWLSNGGNGPSGGSGGNDMANGFTGGAGNEITSPNFNTGGYGGGGGGGDDAGGGGGGYNGGGGGVGDEPGGGGGSYLSSYPSGLISGPTATNTGNGSVAISYSTLSGTGIIAGTYSVTITDNNGCTTTASVTITQPNALRDSIVTSSIVNVACAGQNTGSATVGVKYGTSPYTYSWSNGVTTPATGSVLSAGTYTVTVRDNCAASVTASVTITQAPVLTTPTITYTSVTCNGGSNGSASVLSSPGGTSSYSYLAAVQTFTVPAGVSQITLTLTGGAGGNGENSSYLGGAGASFTGVASVTGGHVLGIVTGGQGQPGNTYVSDDAGGGGGGSYVWDENTTTLLAAAAGGGGAGWDASNGGAGGTNLTTNATTQNATSNAEPGGSNGAGGTVVGGAGGGAGWLSNGANDGTVLGGSDRANGFIGGTTQLSGGYGGFGGGGGGAGSPGGGGGGYNGGGSGTSGAEGGGGGGSFFNTAYGSLPTNATATNTGNGSVTIMYPATAGGAYTYTWSPGGQTGSNATGLSAGTYTVTAENSCGASATASVIITQPNVLTASAAPINGACNGSSNGNALASPSGGASPYTYSWSYGGTANPTGAVLSAGTYSVTIHDNCGNSATASVNIIQSPVMTATTSVTAPILCNGGATGAADVGVSGGISPYTYSWSEGGGTNATINTYSVAGTDNFSFNGNLAAGTGTIQTFTVPAGVTQVSITVTGAQGGDGNNTTTNVGADGAGFTGIATVTPGHVLGIVVGGMGDDLTTTDAGGGGGGGTYVWDENTTTLIAVAGGGGGAGYSVASLGIGGTNLTTNATTTSGADSPGGTGGNGGTGGAATYGAGGAGWLSNGGAASPAAGGSDMANGFTGGSNSSYPAQNGGYGGGGGGGYNGGAGGGGYNGGGGSNGDYGGGGGGSYFNTAYGSLPTTVTATNTGNGSVAISYSTLSGTGIIAGTYSVTITDNNGCTTTASVSITQPAVLSASASITANISCYGQNNGSLSVTASNGTSPYTYSWSGGLGANTSISGLSAGTYTVTVQDNCGASITASVTITQTVALSITASVTNACSGVSGEGNALVVPSGGSIPYTYSWSNGATTAATGSVLSIGTYTVTVQDFCGSSASTTVIMPSSALRDSIVAASTVNVTCTGGATGSAVVGTNGGTSPYTYSWSGGGGTNATINSYSLSATKTFSYEAAIQHFSIPAGITQVTISVAGAAGGEYSTTAGGDGASFTGVATVTSGHVLSVVVGGVGVNSASYGGGGGGASWVYDSTEQPGHTGTPSLSSLIAVAGGGGGDGHSTTDLGGAGGTNLTTNITTSGYLSGGVSVGSSVGGTGGNGGVGGQANTGGSEPEDGGAGGAGWFSNGTNSSPELGGNDWASSFLSATGYNSANGGYGGGGGAGVDGGGGGGGYNGGGGGFEGGGGGGGGGGGSFFNTAYGSLPATVTATNTGNGSVTISYSSISNTGLVAGTYSVNVTDASGCIVTASVTITQPGVLRDSIIIASTVNISCNGGSNGSATVGVKYGTSPYTYSWSGGGGNNATASGLGAGTYTVTVNDNCGATATASVTVTQPNALSATASAPNITCYGNTVTATASPSNGTSPYTYSWSGGGGTNSTASGLSAGTYTVTVQDNCNATATASVTITQPNALSATASQTAASYPGESIGSAIANPSGGNSPYTYSWSPYGGTNSSASGLSAGVYIITVQDNCGASATASVTITQPSSLSTGITILSDAGCSGGTIGNLSATPSGGAAPYTYSWSNGSTSNPTGATLSAGTYTVTVEDNFGSIARASATIHQSLAIVPTAFAATNVSCYGLSNGVAKVSLTGGKAPFVYSWSNGGSTYIASGLSAGTYSVTITDSNNCSNTAAVTITQPTLLKDSLASITYPQCNGTVSNATIGVTGGTSPYRYSWSPNVSTTATAAGLTVRSYVVQVKDNNGCYNNLNFSISQPAALRDSIVKSATVNVSCSGGSATVGVKYGTSPYTYSWSSGGGSNATATGLSAGTYTVTVSDAGSCTVTASVSIGQPSTLSATAFTGANISCNGGSTGQAKVSVSGGTSPYIYSWSPGSNSTYIASGLSVGTYTVTVSDNCGASATSLVALTQPASLRDSLATISYPLCTGGTGSATIGVSGGTSPYKYTWSPNVSTTASATGLTVRGYVVQVKDNNGCYNDINFSLTQPAALRDSIVKSATVNISCNGASAGSATAGVKYGTTPYTYSWSPAGGNSATAIGLSGGTYTVTVSDGGGCTVTASVNITQPAALSPTAFIGAGITCNGASNGTAKVSVSGGSIPYTYSWLSPASGSTYIASGLSAGTYTVTVSDNCGASASSSVTVTEPAILSDSVITSSVVSPPCSGGGTGSAAIGVAGGTSPYRYTWSPNVSTTDSASGLTVRGYVVQVKDKNGCYNNITFNVTCSSASETVTYNKENGASCCPSSDNINLYPNPNTGQFTLSGLQQGMILEMYDYTGKMISTMTTTNESMQLNIFNQADGVYLIRILDKDGNLVSEKKVVKTQ